MGVSVASRSRALVRRVRHKALRSDRTGSVHILETMVVGLMVVGAVVAVSTFNAPVSHTESFKSSQEGLVQDSLDSLAGRPSEDVESVIFDSVLEEYVMKAVAGQRTPLMDYLNRTLPAGSQYDVFLDSGFGRPLSIVDGGTPTGESLTGARSFVPKMSYVFMVPEFGKYQQDFHMNVLAIPMHNSILQRDEGVPVEVAVTFKTEEGSMVTQRVYGETALRYNDPDGRRWASTSIYLKDDPYDEDEAPRHFLDASDTPLYASASVDTLLGGEKLGEAYNITVPFVVEESAGHPIPRGAQISVEFPRGWRFEDNKQAWMESELEHWTDFEWDGSEGEGWTIRARLKDPLKDGAVPFPITGNFVMLLDSAYPYFQPLVAWMGGGTQGKSTILLQTPQELDVGGFRREAYLSLPKPMISGEESTLGVSFANIGSKLDGKVTVEKVEIRQPQGDPLFNGVAPGGDTSWVAGEWDWNESLPDRLVWTPSGGSSLSEGEAAWLSLRVIGGPTRDNHYRNHDYQDVLFHFDPDNTTEGGGGGNWSHVQRAQQMGGEYVYRQLVPPLEDEGWPGWPDQVPSYWFGAESRQQNRYAVGNSSYEVDTTAAVSQFFGDYQGDHVLSTIELADPLGEEKRTFNVEDRVHIKNDFSALFTRLSTLHLDELDLSVENIRIESKVYTPEKAWTGVPTKSYSEDASFEHLSGTFGWLLPMDITDNGILDLVAVDTAGKVYGLDGRDGSKLWQFDHKENVEEAELADVTADGVKELVIADSDDHLAAYRLGLDLSEDDREVWSFDLDPSLLDASSLLDLDASSFHVTAMQDVSRDGMDLGDPVVALAYSSTSDGASVFLVSTEQDEDGAYHGVVDAEHVSATTLDDYTWIEGMVLMEHDLGDGTTEQFLAVGSMNRTVTALSLPGLEVHWITKLPQRANDLSAADLTGDGWDDLVVNAAAVSGAEELDLRAGDSVYVLLGRTGHFGSSVRSVSSLVPEDFHPLDSGFSPQGWGVAVGGLSEIMQDHSGFYSPQLTPPGLGACDLESVSGSVNIGLALWDAEAVISWLEGQQWTGVHVDPSTNELLIVSKDGAILKAVEACSDGRMKWTAVSTGSSLSSSFNAVHSFQPDETDGSLYRMADDGRIEAHNGTDWGLVADVCTMPELDPCDNITVDRWSVEEDEDGRPVGFWAALEWVDPDGLTKVAHVVSIGVDDLAAPEGPVGDALWSDEYSSSTRTVDALASAPGGKVWFGGGTGEGGLFLMHRNATDASFAEDRVFYSTATHEHGGSLLDILRADDGSLWAVSEDGQAWRRTTADTWVPHPSWAGASSSASLAEDHTGTVWLFQAGADHLPLVTHEPEAELRFKISTSMADGSEYIVQVESEEAHVDADGKEVTGIRWYARPSGSVSGGGAHPWTLLDEEGLIVDLGTGWETRSISGRVAALGASSSIEVKAVLETRAVTGDDGTLVQDSGATPALGRTDFTVRNGGAVVAAESFDAHEAQPQDDGSHYDATIEAYQLAEEPPTWMYRGGQNKVYPDGTANSHNRRVGTSDGLPTTSGGPGLAIADQSTNYFDWWVVDGGTGAPDRPSTGPEGSGDLDYVDHILVGDVTGDGVDDVVILGDFEGDVNARIWDTEKDEWSFLDGYGDHIIQAAALMGKHHGRDTFIFSLPAKSLNLVPDSLDAEADEAHALASYFGPEYDESLPGYDEPELRWSSAPHITQGFTTFSYEIPKNSLYGTSLVVSELKFDLTSAGETVTQTARLLEWFDILPPGRTQSVPPVYTVEVVAWFDEGYGQVENRADDDGTDTDGGGLNILPEPKDPTDPANAS